jgi:tetratricopeptide (TPR) repeat protein
LVELKGLPEPVSVVEIGWERGGRVDGRPPLPPPLAARAGAFPFSGRGDVLAALGETWKAHVAAGTHGCVLLAGEPGIGKTRLASEFARRVYDEGGLVLFGRCDEDLGIAYQPFAEALRYQVSHSPSGSSEPFGERPGPLLRLDPTMTERFGDVVAEPATGDAAADQYRLFEAVLDWLATAASAHGAVLVLDDIHWATKPTLLLLRHLLTTDSLDGLLVVATYRDTDLDRSHPLAALLADLRRVDGVERIALAGLDVAGVEQLMEATARQGLDDDGRALAAAVHAETEGNAFFVVEVLRHLAETGALVFDGDRWVAAGPVAEMAIPDGVREVVGRRVSRLSEDANDVLSWAAVMGRDLRLDVLARVAGGQLRCLDALDEAVDARLVDEVGPGRWRFSHALVASTLLAELRTTRRVRMNLDLGEAFEAVAPNELEQLARHFGEAAPLGAGDKAASYLLAAGGAALESLAFDEAADLHERAIDLIDDLDLDLPAELADAWYGVAMARRWTGGDYAAALDAAIETAGAISDRDRIARAMFATSRGYAARTFEVDEAAVARAERSLALIGSEPTRARALVLCQLTNELLFSHDLPRLFASAVEAEAVLGALDPSDRDVELNLFWLGILVNLNILPDRLDDLVALRDRIAQVATGADPNLVSRRWLATWGLAAFLGDPDGEEEASAALSAVTNPPPFLQALLAAGQSGHAARHGDLDDAVRLAQEVLDAMAGSGEPDAYLWWLNLTVFARRQQGRPQDAIDVVEPVVSDEYRGFLPVDARTAADGLPLWLLCEAERHDEARALAPPLIDAAKAYVRGPVWSPVVGCFAIVAAELRDPSCAWFRDQLLPMAHLWATWGNLGTVAPVTSLLGRLEAALGDHDQAEVWFARSIDRCRAARAPFFLADALLELGRSQTETEGALERAAAPLAEALDLAVLGGYATIERRARNALGLG